MARRELGVETSVDTARMSACATNGKAEMSGTDANTATLGSAGLAARATRV